MRICRISSALSRGLLGGFRERARLTSELLRSRACGFVLVAGPDPEQVRRAVAFSERLRQERVQLAGLVVNRMRTWPAGLVPDTGAEACKQAQRWLEPALGTERAARLVEVARRQAGAARRDAEGAERIEKALALERGDMRRIPLLAEDIHTPRGLLRLRAHLFGPAAVSHSSKIRPPRQG